MPSGLSYLNQTELQNQLTSNGHLSSSVQTKVVDYLASQGAFHYNVPDWSPNSALVQTNPFYAAGSPQNQVLDLLAPNAGTIDTTGTAIQAIVLDTNANANLTVKGSNDTVIGMGNGDNLVVLQDAGHDLVLAGDGNVTIADTAGGHDTLVAGGGHTVIWGYGQDTLEGSATGNSELHGGEWSTIHSNSAAGHSNVLGSGSINGTADTLYGGAGADTLFGGGGQDTLYAGTGDNTLIAGSGHHQHLFGGGGSATLISYVYGQGDDTLTAGEGSDTLWGYGHDTLEGSLTGHAVLHGGVNSELISRSTTTGSNILASGSTQSGEANILRGGQGLDTLYGGAGEDSLYGGSGANTLISGSGSNQLLQAGDGVGNTLLDGTSGGHFDTLFGGSGDDVLIGKDTDLLNGGGGNDTLWSYGGNETLQGGAGNDVFHVESHTGNDTIEGGSTAGGETNIVGFAGRALEDVTSLVYDHATQTYTLTFTDNQQVTMRSITDLYFTNGVQHLYYT